MKDIRRIFLWVILGLSLALLWDRWQVYNGRTATFFPDPAAVSQPADTESAADERARLSEAAVPHGETGVPPTDASKAEGLRPPQATVTAGERFTVNNGVLKLDFDTEGGSIVRAELLRYRKSSKSPDNLLLMETNGEHVYQVQSGLIGSPALPNHTTLMQLDGPRDFASGQNELQLRFVSPDTGGAQLVKTYTIQRDNYVIGVRDEVHNTGTAPLDPRLYLQFERDGSQVAGATSFYSSFTGPAFYNEESKYQKIKFKDIDKDKFKLAKAGDGGYVAMVQHYFAGAWVLDPDVSHANFVRKIGDDRYTAGVTLGLGEIPPGGRASNDSRLFVGPQEAKLLESISPGLELVRDYGWLTILSVPIFWLLDKLHSFIGNWGWSIVALVVLLKIAFYWLNAKAYGSMAKMKALNPRIQEMRKRLKDDPKQMQMEMMRIYREEKVNPLGGCFPIAVQIPVFIALYWVLLASVEMRGAPWIFWIQDLSIKDPYFILPVLMTLTTLLQTALNPAPPDPMQAKLMWLMPLAFSVMFFLFPAGLVLYWFTNNLLSIAQQWLINTRMGVPPSFNLPSFLKKAKPDES